jgi:hypothetical protein
MTPEDLAQIEAAV